MEVFAKDLKIAGRTLMKNPGFTAIAIITLALGIAVNATMFSMVSAFLLRRPPGHEPERVAVVTSVDPTSDFQPDATPVSVPNYLAWRNANNAFTEMAAADQRRSVSLNSANQAVAVRAAAASPNYFKVLGVTPQFGRAFQVDEDQLGKDHVVILSHEFWQRHFASDPELVGHTIRINREPYNVIGVMPASFRLMGYTPQLWIPLVITPADQNVDARRTQSLLLFGRLKPGVTLEQARADMSTLARQAEHDFPDIEKGRGAAVRTLPDFLIYDFGLRSALVLTMMVVAFVLMIACANVAGLLLARFAGRRKELSIRLALGSSRVRLVRQLLTEALMLAFAGGSLGLFLTYWGVHFVRVNMSFNDAISAVPVRLDWNVILFVTGAAALSALLSGLIPAMKGSRTDIAPNLKDENRGSSLGRAHRRLRSIMVTGQVALALFLLVGAGLLFREIYLIEHQKLGFEPDHLLTAAVTLDKARYQDASHQTIFVQKLVGSLQSIPGVESAAIVSELPATGPGSVTFRIQNEPVSAPNHERNSAYSVITPDFFRVCGIALLRGRRFTEADNVNAQRVVIVNNEFVHRFLPNQESVGQHIQLDVAGGSSEWSEIVGVVSTVKAYSEAIDEQPQIYEPFFQRPTPRFSLMLRSTPDPNNLMSSVRSAVAQIDADLPLARMMSMTNVIDRQKAANPFFTRVLGTFAFLALILAATGIYGLIAYSVDQQTHEIGIRMALGADKWNVLRMILAEGVKLTAIGTAIGVALALPLPRLFSSLLYGLQVHEFRLYFIVPFTIFLVALLAMYVPARRAVRVDPLTALRQE
ncbi:MAG TPA: ABC transporter permease [Candidatus Angelobacter sp.]|jgi:putative ABC transport system permease protein